jgi:hypothetical protein
MFTKHGIKAFLLMCATACILTLAACGQNPEPTVEATGAAAAEAEAEASTPQLTDAEVENIVRRAYRFVAIYNVNNKGGFDESNPMSAGGLNRMFANTRLADHTVQVIARPNNDTLYVSSLLDLSTAPVIIEAPVFDSKYVSLMVTGYDHYVNIPMSTRLGDFSESSRILFYTERTPGYSGEPVEGIDQVVEMTGDYVSAVYRVMPHANEPERLQSNLEAMQSIKVLTLPEFISGETVALTNPAVFPAFGVSDFDVFENNFLEVMQFVFNHTSFDAEDEIDQGLLAAFEPLGVVPGREFDPAIVMQIDGARFRAVAERISAEELARANDPQFLAENVLGLFLPKGQMTDEILLFQSILGPLGQPASEAVYPAITSADGQPLNAMNDYVIRITAEEMPPATAFWSLTLYDNANGFFMPNDRKKYSVGENAGMQLDEEGGITIHVAAEQPEGVPDENWLPLVRGDYAIDVLMRIYAPDLQRFADWNPPAVEIAE